MGIMSYFGARETRVWLTVECLEALAACYGVNLAVGWGVPVVGLARYLGVGRKANSLEMGAIEAFAACCGVNLAVKGAGFFPFWDGRVTRGFFAVLRQMLQVQNERFELRVVLMNLFCQSCNGVCEPNPRQKLLQLARALRSGC